MVRVEIMIYAGYDLKPKNGGSINQAQSQRCPDIAAVLSEQVGHAQMCTKLFLHAFVQHTCQQKAFTSSITFYTAFSCANEHIVIAD